MTLDLVPTNAGTFDLLPHAAQLAAEVARTNFVPKGLRGDAPAVVAAILTGHELGIAPMQAIRSVHVIDGKPTLAAEIQRALVLAAGHSIEVVESTSKRCTLRGVRADRDLQVEVTWTMEDATRAGLAQKQNWRHYPRQMLVARATAELTKLVFADVTGGLSATEELDDEIVDVAEDGTVLDTAPAKPKTVRRRTPAKSKAKPAPAVIDVEPIERIPLPGEEGFETLGAPTPAEPEQGTPARADAEPSPNEAAPAPAKRDTTDAQRLAIHAAKTGLDDETRHDLIGLLTQGRTRTATELTTDEIAVVRSVIDDLEAGRAVIAYAGDGTLQLRREDGAEDDLDGEATWREKARKAGVTQGKLLTHARELARMNGLPAPTALAEIVHPTLVSALDEWLSF